jgi:anti-anti-sigma regulatory factor
MFRSRPKQVLSYFISETHDFAKDYSVAVVTLVGSLSKETSPILLDCHEQLSRLKCKWIILNFRDTQQGIDSHALATLKSLQQTIREKPIILKFSGVHPDMRQVFLSEKIVIEEDLFNNLAEALQFTSALHEKEVA